MRVSVSYLSCAVLGGLLGATPVQAQFPLVQPSFSVGAAVPARSEADTHGTGIHLGAALKLPILPLQVEGAFDRMGADAEGAEDLDHLARGGGRSDRAHAAAPAARGLRRRRGAACTATTPRPPPPIWDCRPEGGVGGGGRGGRFPVQPDIISLMRTNGRRWGSGCEQTTGLRTERSVVWMVSGGPLEVDGCERWGPGTDARARAQPLAWTRASSKRISYTARWGASSSRLSRMRW